MNNEIKLVSWNIAKGNTDGWLDDLRELATDAQLVLLQEALFIDEMKRPHGEPIYWTFAPGYRTNAFHSGIMTLSRSKPDMIHSLFSKEPWLRSPKITNITKYHHDPDQEPLLVVNVHAINFTFGIRAYTAQLEAISEVLRAHDGPIVFSGDLNTWSGRRTKALLAMAEEVGLSAVTFEPDHRTRRFGRALDYVFVRGLEVKSSHTVKVATSDHNPLILTLAVSGA